MNANYSDNFWDQLPIEPLKVDVMALPGMQGDIDSSPGDFDRAEEKAVKAVQKHSMLIARKERNSQIDNAYLLLGKSRYYSKRFVPALEAFNYIITNYPNADLINETKIWRSKTQIRLRNEERAVVTLSRLLKQPDLDSKIKEDAHTAIAMAYVRMDSIQLVINHLQKAVKSESITEQTYRNLFILGQLYGQKKLIDSSKMAFQKIIDQRKAPYKYKIHAQIEKAKIVEDKEDAESTLIVMNKLVDDPYNKPYLDELYYQIGLIEREHNQVDATHYFEQSLRASRSNNFQKELSYEALGDFNFDRAKFITAAAYYDSILQIAKNDNTKRIRRLKRERKNLDEVIFYENSAKVNDSIIAIIEMSDAERTFFFNEYIENLKAIEEEKLKQEKIQEILLNSSKLNENNAALNGSWYFYNFQAAVFGEQEFKSIWGNRKLEDYWRISEKFNLNSVNIGGFTVVKTTTVDEEQKYKISYYLERIPSSQTKIDSLNVQRNYAYYQLGLIYKEQFKEIELATNYLEKLISFNPQPSILLSAKYNLYKIYSKNKPNKAMVLKNEIVNNFPTSQYAKILLNPGAALLEDTTNSPESEYATLYHNYKEEKYDSVIENTTIAIGKYEDHQIVPKFELLKAYAIGKKEGLNAFKQALDFVLMNYPNTEEGKKALELIDRMKSNK